MTRCDENNINDMLSFIFEAPCEEDVINMDCNDYCGQIAKVAEQVASGIDLEELLPQLECHLKHWVDCREEFEGLVAVLKAHSCGEVGQKIDQMISEATNK